MQILGTKGHLKDKKKHGCKGNLLRNYKNRLQAKSRKENRRINHNPLKFHC